MDTGAVLSAGDDRCLAGPKGQVRIAQRFKSTLGRHQKVASPEGTDEVQSHTASFSRPFGTFVPSGLFPGVKTPGYSRDVPPGQRNVAATFTAEQATRFISDAIKDISRLRRCAAARYTQVAALKIRRRAASISSAEKFGCGLR